MTVPLRVVRRPRRSLLPAAERELLGLLVADPVFRALAARALTVPVAVLLAAGLVVATHLATGGCA